MFNEYNAETGEVTVATLKVEAFKNHDGSRVAFVAQMVNPSGYWRSFTFSWEEDTDTGNILDQISAEGVDAADRFEGMFEVARNTVVAREYKSFNTEEHALTINVMQRGWQSKAESILSKGFAEQHIASDIVDWANEVSSNSVNIMVEKTIAELKSIRKTISTIRKEIEEKKRREEEARRAQELRLSCGGGTWATW